MDPVSIVGLIVLLCYALTFVFAAGIFIWALGAFWSVIWTILKYGFGFLFWIMFILWLIWISI
jgi:hypothetical protein